MGRTTLTRTLAALTLLCGLTPAAHARGGHGGGGTYHYNGSSGYWSGGGYAGANTYCAPQPMPQTYQTAYYAPQPTYYAPQPTYTTPQIGVYAQPQTSWRAAAVRR